MRVAVVATLVTPIVEPLAGGSQVFIADLARGLTARGHDVDVYAASGSSIDGASVIDTGIEHERLHWTRFRADEGDGAAGDASVTERAFERVYSLIDAHDYDVVHNHAFDAAAIRLASSLNAQVVHTLHLPPARAVAEAINSARSTDRPPIIVAVSATQATSWSRFATVDAVIRNGVPVERIPWSETPGTGVIFAGRFSPEKGVVPAIEIARRAGMEIDIYGSAYDHDYFRNELMPLASLTDARLHPPLPRNTLWERMEAALAVLCPSLWDEPFSLVAAESQATATPVVAFASGALPEVIVDGETGFCVPQGDIDAAARGLANVHSLDRRRCREHAQQSLDLERTIDAYEKLYRGDLASSPGCENSSGMP